MSKLLRFSTFLAPSIRPVYEAVAGYVGRELGCDTVLVEGRSFGEFAEGACDIGFICGLPYVQLAAQDAPPVELLAAPVLQGERYGGRPIYFSDVIVRSDAPFHSFADLRGRSWSYNDPDSHSGYGVTRYHLVRLGETRGYFGSVVAAGFHQESIRMVREGEIDASAIDSQVLAVAMRDDAELARQVRVIGRLGPSSIQRVVAARTLPDSLKADEQAAILRMHTDAEALRGLSHGLVERFVPVADADYDDIREMLAATGAAGFEVLR
ncbi:MAG TPA: PhnD/SsuA/transferrin family substrate-binding protein [Chloroflexia bacterium]|nr:PhnD/SsuA/transferrin family substrate-binding protein [Chloroflexia bacterium]